MNHSFLLPFCHLVFDLDTLTLARRYGQQKWPKRPLGKKTHRPTPLQGRAYNEGQYRSIQVTRLAEVDGRLVSARRRRLFVPTSEGRRCSTVHSVIAGDRSVSKWRGGGENAVIC